MKTSKITLATVKSFIKNNNGKLFINVKSSFDGMIDGCETRHDGFTAAVYENDCNAKYTLGIKNAWFVGSSRDYFETFENEIFTGIEVSNSCGCFILATKK